jgi:pyruvate formate-lyase activating enzyme-like uncharacterized protein
MSLNFMENKPMTAIEWLNAELEKLTTRAEINMSWAMMDDLLKQAKKMERQQIVEAWCDGAHPDKDNTVFA